MELKHCNGCDTDKPLSDFHRRYERPIGYRSKCKECCNINRKKHYEADKKSGKLKETIWKRSNINITYEEYVEKYNKLEGKCEICGDEYDVLCVDHNHETEEIRGLLCTQCNLSIEGFKESPNIMKNAIKYITKYGGRNVKG